MDELTFELSPKMLMLVPVVAAIIQQIKAIKIIEPVKEWLPLAALGISLGLCYALKIPNPILPAIMIGLAASGGYDLVKGKKKPNGNDNN